MIPFLYQGPTDTAKELARFRDTLLRFIEGVVPPAERETGAITLNMQHVIRFMEHCQRAERTERELEAGLHEAQARLQDKLIEAQHKIHLVCIGAMDLTALKAWAAENELFDPNRRY